MSGMVTTSFSNTSLDISRNIMIAAGAAYKFRENEWPDVIKKESTDLINNKRMRYEGAGALPERTESAPSSTSNFNEGYVESTTLKEFAYDMPVSWLLRNFAVRNANFVNQMGTFQGRSAALRYEYTGMSPINNGYSSTAPYASADGEAYFSASHLFKSGDTYSNLLTAADLSKTPLENGLKAMSNAKMENNIPAKLIIDKCIVAYENIITLPELLKSTLDPESGNNTINVIRDFGIMKVLNHYQSDTNAWTLDSKDPSRSLYEAQKPTLDKYMNNATKELVVSMHTCIGSGIYDMLNSFGNQGT